MGDTRHEFSALLTLYLPIGIAVFLVVALAMAYVVVRYRHRPGNRVSDRHDAPRLELTYALVVAVIAAILVIATYHQESHEDALAASPGLRIVATGSDWRWRFDYPAQGITELGQGQQPTPLYVPARETIEFDLGSLDVIHAFYLPYERFQRAAIPRVVNRFDLMFPTPGVRTSGQCNEFCGIGHTQMRFTVHVLSTSQFADWVRSHRRGGSA